MKKLACIFMALIMTLSICALSACDNDPTPAPGPDNNNTTDSALDLRFCETYAELHIPDAVADDIGLWYFDSDSQSFIKVTDHTVPFDTSKPTIFYTHGQGYHGPGMDNTACTYYPDKYDRLEDYWVDAGYNVLSFAWGPLSGFASPWDIQANIWSDDLRAGRYVIDGGDTVYEYHEYCAAEIFGISIYSFLSQYPTYTMPIRLEGLSMGGQMVCATASYLESLVSHGKIDKKYLPYRVTMCDPFVTNGNHHTDYKVGWLGEDIGKTGSIGLMARVCAHLHEAGVLMEYFHTGKGDAGRDSTNPDPDVDPLEYLDLWHATCFADYSNENGFEYINKYYQDRGVSLISDLESYYSGYHVSGVSLYAYMIENGILYDVELDGEYAFGASTPMTYSMARVGAVYDLAEKKTEAYVANDQMYVKDVYVDGGSVSERALSYGKVAGIIMEDKNNNGIFDENMAYRVCDVTVKLYADNAVVATTTAKGGYYEFVLDNTYNGKTLKVEFVLPEGYSIGAKATQNESDAYYMMNNELTTNTSATFVIDDVAGRIRIVNAGLTK